MIVETKKNQYGHNQLYKDIEKLNEIQYRYSLVAIKNTFEPYPNRYLLYYDERWQCKFFFRYKTVDNDEDHIKNKLASELKIDKSCISMEFKKEQIQKKYSVSHNEERIYDHRLYYAVISEYNDLAKNKEFEIDGKKFYWMTFQEMQQDRRIQEINEDVVDLVKSVSI